MEDNRLNTLGQIKTLTGVAHGSCQFWFSPETMRWFRSRVSESVYPTRITSEGTYFVTSEKNGWDGVRRYTVRQACIRKDEFGIYAVITTPDQRNAAGFQYFKSLSGAHAAAKRMRDRAVKDHDLTGTLFEK